MNDRIRARRDLISPRRRPATEARLDMELTASLGENMRLKVRYHPARFVLPHQALKTYLDGLEESELSPPETLAALIAEDLDDVLIPHNLDVQLDISSEISSRIRARTTGPSLPTPLPEEPES